MKSKKKFIVRAQELIFCIGVCCASSAAFAADYYVSSSGSASWSTCTNINMPCSLQTASYNAVAGDTVYLRGGTYVLPFVNASGTNYWSSAFEPANSGAPMYPITFTAYNEEYVFFDASANDGQLNSVASYGVTHKDYIIFDGINTQSSQDSSGKAKTVLFKSSNNCTVKNAEITGSSGNSNNSGIRAEDTDSITVQNMIVHGFAGGETNASGMMLYSCNNLLVERSTFYGNGVGIYDKSGSTNNTYRFNYFYDNSLNGYLLQQESGGPTPHDLIVSQSIFRNNGDAIELSGSTIKDDVTIYNNIFYSSGKGITMWGSGGVTDLHVYNNIFRGGDTATDYSNAGTGLYSDYNQFYSVTIGDDSGSNSLTSNPNFVNSGGSDPEDYKRSSYPQDGRGGSYPSVRGAYITGDEIIGYNSDGPPPPEVTIPQDFLLE